MRLAATDDPTGLPSSFPWARGCPPRRSSVRSTLKLACTSPAGRRSKTRTFGHLVGRRVRLEGTGHTFRASSCATTSAAWRMATPARRRAVSGLWRCLLRGKAHLARRPSQRPTRRHEPRDQPGGGKARGCNRAGGQKPAPDASTPCHPDFRTHQRGQARVTTRLQLRTAPPRRWMATGEEHGRGPLGSRSPVLFLAPAMVARMRRDAAWRLDFP